MSQEMPSQFDGVRVVCKANVYFDGNVVSHSIFFPDGSKKSVGVMRAGTYTFNTEAPERMEMVAGSCRVKVGDEGEWKTYDAGSHFDVPGQSSFDIEIGSGIVEYVCSFN